MTAELPVDAIVLYSSQSLPAENLIAAITDNLVIPHVETEFRWSRDPDVYRRVYTNVKRRIRNATIDLPVEKCPRYTPTLRLLGCSVKSYIKYLESKWLPGMNWSNYCQNGWHIDHVIGIMNWDLTKQRHVRSCFHYKNTQPLWARLNSKKTKYTPNVDISLYLLPAEPEDNEEE